MRIARQSVARRSWAVLPRRLLRPGVIALLAAVRGPSPSGADEQYPLRAIAAPALAVESGSVDREAGELPFRVEQPGMRAIVRGSEGDAAELVFRYRGPSRETVPLRNGEERRQIGLKLRAEDSCNVLYVMWHVEPTPGVFVSLKENAGQTSHDQCEDHGYVNLQPVRSAPTPPLLPGSTHALRAVIQGDAVRVIADGAVVWEGALPADARNLQGPVGVRSDNGDFDFALRASFVDGPQLAAGCGR